MTTLAESLAAAQAEMENPGFDAVNPHFKSKFASLKEVARVARKALHKHGIFVGQEITGHDGQILCTTVLKHRSGEEMRFGPTPFPVPRNDPQGYGSACTYARRYSLSASLCLVGDDDDDGNAATAAASNPISPEQAAELKALIEEVGADTAKFLGYLKVEKLEQLPAADYSRAVKALERKRAAA